LPPTVLPHLGFFNCLTAMIFSLLYCKGVVKGSGRGGGRCGSAGRWRCWGRAAPGEAGPEEVPERTLPGGCWEEAEAQAQESVPDPGGVGGLLDVLGGPGAEEWRQRCRRGCGRLSTGG